MQATATSSDAGPATSGRADPGRMKGNTTGRFQGRTIRFQGRTAVFIEIHAIQNFAPSNLNRDDTGSPKECEFGGQRRARVSSQCWKRAVREYFSQENLIPEAQLAVRTKQLVARLAELLIGRTRER